MNKKLQKIIAIFLVAALLVPSAAVMSQAASANDTWDGTTAVFAEGDGSALTPFLISTSEQLAYLSAQVSSGVSYIGQYFKLEANLDLSGYEWQPIGSVAASLEGSSSIFMGDFNGNNKTITGMTITNPYYGLYNVGVVGLFGHTQRAKIYGLGVENINIDVTFDDADEMFTAYAGGITGTSYSDISDCYTTGTIKVTSSSRRASVGGLVGIMSYIPESAEGAGDGCESTMTNCHSSVNVTSITVNEIAIAGGLVSQSYSGTITSCYATGDVSATGTVTSASSTSSATAGGITGFTMDSTFTDCYATGNVTAVGLNACAGGFAGDCRNGLSSFTNCFATGNVSSTTNDCAVSAAGGFAGITAENTYSIVNCYRNSAQTFTTTESSEGNGCNSGSDQFRQGSTATNTLGDGMSVSSFADESFVADTLLWNLTDEWIIDTSSDVAYPQLRNAPEDISVTGVSFAETSAQVKYGDTLLLTPVFAPEIATNTNATYEVTGGTSVQVDNSGMVTPVAIGDSVIKVTTEDGGFTAEITVTVIRGDSTIAAPSLLSKTDSSVSLAAPATTGDGGEIVYGFSASDDDSTVATWQAETEFTGLDRYTTYYFFAKVSDGTNYLGSVSDALEVITDKTAISGSVSITGTAQFAQKLTADTQQILPTDATLDYQWYNGDDAIEGAVSNEYTIAAADIGAAITVTVTANGSFTGNVASEAVTPTKADRTIAAPVSSGSSDTQIAFDAPVMTGDGTVYYGIASSDDITAATWQSEAVFTGLTRNTTYYFFAKVVDSDNYFDAQSLSAAVATLKTDVGGAITINGVAEYGEILTAEVQIAPEGATYSYQWFRDGTEIDGATAAQYTVDTADIDADITVKALGTGDYTADIESSAVVPTRAARTIAVPTEAAHDDSSVTLDAVTVEGDGTVEYGASLTSDYTQVIAWDADTVISDLTRNTTFYIFARVTGGTNYADAVSQALEVVTDKSALTGTAAISGVAEYDSEIAFASSILPATATFDLQWFRDGNAIEAATDTTYTVTADDIGKSITVKATATATGDFIGVIESEAVVPTRKARTIDAPTVSGNTDSTVALTAVTATGDGSVIYGSATTDDATAVTDWQVATEFAGLLRNTTYYFFAKAIGGTLYADAVSASVSKTTDKTEAVGTVSIKGTAQFGSTLTAQSELTPSDATVSYEWLKDGAEIDGAVGNEYVVTADDIGAAITVFAIATGDFYGEFTSTAVIPSKASREVAAPVAASKTDASVTLDAIALTGDGDVTYGYSIDNSPLAVANWQSELEFNGLARNTEYFFFAKVSGGANYADAVSSGTSVITDKTEIAGTVTFVGDGKCTTVLTASADILPSDATFGYQWFRDGNAIEGATDAAYTVTLADIGAIISVKAIANGSFTGEIAADATVTGSAVNVTGVTLDKTSANVKLGTKMTLVAAIAPANASNKAVTWTSSNTSIATVDANGVVTAKAKGSVVITAKTEDGNKTATCSITVVVPVASISVPESITVTLKGTGKIDATISPDTSSVKSITWSSSNGNVVTVDGSGNVRAVGRGSATITATLTDFDGTTHTDTCKVNVKVLWWQWLIIIILFGFIWY